MSPLTSKQETFSQCWCNVGPPSQTVPQHYTSIGSASRRYCVSGAAVRHYSLPSHPASNFPSVTRSACCSSRGHPFAHPLPSCPVSCPPRGALETQSPPDIRRAQHYPLFGSCQMSLAMYSNSASGVSRTRKYCGVKKFTSLNIGKII